MLIFFWRKWSDLLTEEIPGFKCPKCNEEKVLYHVTGSYAHIFWIPMIPLWRNKSFICTACESFVDKKDIPEQQEDMIKEMKKNARTPWWYFSWLILLILVMIFWFFASKQSEKNNISYLENPIIGDIYETSLLTWDYPYSLDKVVSVTETWVWLLPNIYYVDMKSALDEINIDSYYTWEIEFLEKEWLLRLYENKFILDVNR